MTKIFIIYDNISTIQFVIPGLTRNPEKIFHISLTGD